VTLVDTEVAVVYLLSLEGVTETQARRWLYRLSADGLLVNHGNKFKGRARWDLWEIRDLCKAGVFTTPPEMV